MYHSRFPQVTSLISSTLTWQWKPRPSALPSPTEGNSCPFISNYLTIFLCCLKSDMLYLVHKDAMSSPTLSPLWSCFDGHLASILGAYLAFLGIPSAHLLSRVSLLTVLVDHCALRLLSYRQLTVSYFHIQFEPTLKGRGLFLSFFLIFHYI